MLDSSRALKPFSSIDNSKNIRQIKLVNESVYPTEVCLQYLLTVLYGFPVLYILPITFSPKYHEGILKKNLGVRNDMVGSLLLNDRGVISANKNYLRHVDSLVNNKNYITCEGCTLEELEFGNATRRSLITYLVPSAKQRAILNLVIWLEKNPHSFETAIDRLLQSEPFKDLNFKDDWLCLEHCDTFSSEQGRFFNGCFLPTNVSCKDSFKRGVPFINKLLTDYNHIPIEGLLTHFLRDAQHNPVSIQHVEMYHHTLVSFDIERVLSPQSGVLVKNFEAILKAGYNLLRPNYDDVLLVLIAERLFSPEKYGYFRPFLPELLSLVRNYLGQGSIDTTMATAPIYHAYYDRFLLDFFWRLATGQSFGFDTAFSRAVMLIGEAASVLCEFGASPNAVPNPQSGLTLIDQAILYLGIMTYVVSNPETTLEDLPPDLANLFKKHFSRILALCGTDTRKAQFWKGYTAQMTAEYRPNTIRRVNNYVAVVQSCIKGEPQQGAGPGLFAKSTALPVPEAAPQVQLRYH